MNKLDMQSIDIVDENIEKISELFPNVIVESANGKTIDFDLLKQELSKEIVDGVKEKYQLTWPGKKEAIVNANTPSKNTLRPIKEKSVDFDNTKNIYIEGDNLEVLKEIYENYHKGYAFESTNWQDLNFQTVELKQVIRQKNPEFIHELNKARIGDYSCVHYFNTHCQKTLFENGIILTATNRKAEQINHDRLSKIPYKAKVYHSRIVGDVKNSDKPTLDELHLKIGARVMVLINDTEQNLYQNGSFGKVYKLEDESVTVLLDTNKTLVTFGYHEWAIENYVLSKRKEGDIEDNHLSKEKVGAFYQIPLKLAYAITMHKSQGQTYDQVNLIPYSFDNGQLYVALSRVKSIEGLCLINQLRQENLICSQEVKNFYHIGSSKSKDKLIYELGKKVLNSHITYPKEIQDLIDYIHKMS